MPYDPDQHHRRSVRLADYDYSQPGAYFVTVCTHGRRPLFGQVVDEHVRPSNAGLMASDWWRRTKSKFPTIELDEEIVMPNHLHAIVNITANGGATLQEIVQWFKTMTTNAYLRGVKQLGWPRFEKRLWQRSYYEHVIRDEAELASIREYIHHNPAKWVEDPDNPSRAIVP